MARSLSHISEWIKVNSIIKQKLTNLRDDLCFSESYPHSDAVVLAGLQT